MIDTIHATLYLNWQKLNNIQSLLTTIQSRHDNLDTGKTSYRGGIKNLSVQINEHRIKFEGSLSKFHLGNNTHSLDAASTKLAIEELSDLTSLPIKDAQINRLDLAQNLSVKHPATSYYNYFGERKYMQRLEQGSGLYYRNTLGERVVYDKSKEQSKFKDITDPDLLAQKLLRFEVRYYGHRNICKHFDVPEMKFGQLCAPTFYRGLVSDWAAEYTKIEKNKDILLFNDDVYREPKQFCNQMTFKGIQAMGGLNAVRSLVKEARKRNVFRTTDQFHALQRKLRSLNMIADNSVPNRLIDEIDARVLDIVLLSA
jgi:hypothetical protein